MGHREARWRFSDCLCLKTFRHVLQVAYLTHKLLQNILLRRPRQSSQWVGASALLLKIGFGVLLNCSGHLAAPVSPTGSPGDLAARQGSVSKEI